MKKIKISKIIGIIFFVAFVLMIFVAYAIGILHYLGVSILSQPWGLIIYAATTFLFLSLSEGFFIKSGIVPKLLKYIIYIQWVFVSIVLIVSIIDILCC